MHVRPIRQYCPLIFALILAVLVPATIVAQTNTTRLSGIVTDPTGALIPEVAVELSKPDIGFVKVVKSDSGGAYSFDQVTPGSYTVTVSAAAFSPEVEKVELLVATPRILNFKLKAGTTEVVNVETTLAQLNSTDATLGKAFDSAQVQNLPYLANNVTYLLSLQPGVLAIDSGAQTGGLNTDPRTGVVNGARQDQTNITLDGVDNNDQVFGYAFNGALRSTRDSVEEFRVTTTNANADAGRSSGAQVSLVTRSGTNNFHGSAYEYYRDPGTTANNWFIKQGQLNSGTPNIAAKVLQHTYGASLGLPIKKDKLFFFGAYEGFKQASDVPVSETVPSVFGGGGLYTGNVVYEACPTTSPGCQNSTILKTLTPTDIAQLDGRASDSNCATTTCYAPATNAAAIAYFKQFPLANAPGAADPYNTGIYNFTSPSPIHQITNIVRLDYNITSKQLLFVRGNLQSDNQATPLQFPGLPAASNVFGNNKGISAGHTWNINDRMTNNARYGFTSLGSASRGTGSQPFVNFGAFSTLTAATTSTVYKVQTSNFVDDFTYVHGRHIVQAGVNITLLSNGQYFDAPLLAEAQVSPNLLATAAIANQGGSYDPGAFSCADCGQVANAYASSYNNAIIANIGAMETATSGTEFKVQNNSLVPQGVGVIPTHTYKNVEQEYYVQDQWKVTPHLTLTGGLRYVHLGVPYEKDGQQIAPTISLNTFLADRISAAAKGSAYDTDISFRASGSPNGQPNFWTPQKYNFAPRLAFAYAFPDAKTSIRGGFAISYDHFGAGVIDAYQSNQQSLLSLGQTNLATYTDINSNPRFTGYHNVPSVQGATSALPLPFTPAESPFTFDYSINDKQKTPYAETFNLTVERQLPHSVDIVASYVGRLGRHLVQNLDVAMPTNFYDPGSNQTYFAAATAFDKMVDAGTTVGAIQNSGFFQNVFPHFAYQDPVSGVNYTGAQAYYDVFAANRGNETNALFQADTDPTASPNGQSFRFFFPQTSSVYAQSTIGTSSYNALQLSVRQVLHYGLEYDVNYTFSKSLDEGSDPERNGSGGSPVINTFSPNQWYAPSDFDVRHNITANYTAPLPFGRGKPFFSNAGSWMDRLIDGFQLNGVVHYSSGFPFSAVDSNNWGTNFAFNSNMVQTGPIPTGGHRYIAAEQTETALKGITSAQANANLRPAYVGESGQRNNFRSDGYLSIDDGLSKSFRTFKEQEFRISAEVFNVLNTNRFASVQTSGVSPNFGVYLNSNTTPALLLQPRQMQFSGKYIF
ncbi:TonB-dependent receptor [Granulicella paludicola]|uniref:TonB-dependent receptor n=1 Tax=Granulicella paludicola TaxID=474951 RepID=UPI0021DF4446|nr:carboxypeptidase-like regulatory domain-containing protein [Granulicella paludicola]